MKDIQSLMTRAKEEHEAYPCFWHRGMMSADFYKIPTPPEACSHQTFGHFSCGGGVYATGGSVVVTPRTPDLKGVHGQSRT